MKRISLLAIITSLIFISCSNERDFPSDKNLQVHDFVWRGLNAYYYWQDDVADLSDSRFSRDQELEAFLSTYDNPETLFEALRYMPGVVDRFSWIVDDYIALENSFQGIRTTAGIKIAVKPYEDGSGNAYAYVRYVLPGSDAENKGITRGMIFNQVNGQTFTTTNISDLFNGDTYNITLANFNNGNPISTTTVINLVKAQIQENPIHVSKIIDQGGLKIGYIMYNQFNFNYDDELNTEFAKFKTEGINEIIIDLRYNGGGRVSSAVNLASMISGQATDVLFAKEVWNKKVNSAFSSSSFNSYFSKKIDYPSIGVSQTINTVTLPKVYFIVSEDTASASELVINGLIPHMNVAMVGTTTVGKQVGSITIYDSDNYTRNGANLNPNHTWAMQAIVLEIVNSNGENRPDGFTPEVQLSENPGDMGVLGESSDPLLARTLQYIINGSTTSTSPIYQADVWNTNMEDPDYQNMYITKLKTK